MPNICKEVLELADRLGFSIGLFGSVLEKGFLKANDIDLVIPEEKITTRTRGILKAYAVKHEKMLDIFLAPVKESETIGKMVINWDKRSYRTDVFCGRDFFSELLIVHPNLSK
jgi:predicted nucleotidyltransferase